MLAKAIHNKPIIPILCILSNLLVGNAIICFMGKDSFAAVSDGEHFYMLHIAMSLSCIFCYYLLFTKIPLQHWNLVKLCLISVATCLLILFIGILITSIPLWGYGSNNDSTLVYIFTNIFTSFLFGFVGTAMFSFVAIPMGLVNVLWLLLYKKNHS